MTDTALLARLRRGDGSAVAGLAETASRHVLAGRIDAAEALLREALALAPAAPALLGRAAGLRRLRGDVQGALAMALAALRGDPGEPMAATLAVDALVDAGRPGEAAQLGRAAQARAPHAQVARALSQAELMLGEAPTAVALARGALAAASGDATMVSSVCHAALYDETLDGRALARVRVEAARQLQPAPGCGPAAARPPLDGRRLRVGLLSPDLRDHPMGRFAAPLLEHLDREAFALSVYARVAQPDALTARLRALPGLVWHDTAGLDDAAVHAAIQRDAIDVLVDLAGHTAGGRPRLLAARAAPLQLAWLGDPHPTGIPNVDAFIADADLVPPGADPPGLERVLRLAGSALCLPPDDAAPAVGESPAERGAAFTFASFNHLAKLSTGTIALWCRLLAAVPDARLALCAIPLQDPVVRRQVHARFAQAGLDPRRLVLLPPRRPLEAFLAQYAAVDVALDPLPFHGGTTSWQALWQGVPVLSLAGDAPQRRMGASLLRAAGLADDCLARDARDFVAQGVALAADRARRLAWRADLRARLAAASDGRDFARRFGAMLLASLQERIHGLP
jgi:predicted O-linked N-acetylglucosamine transferase (SPINDLY family)